MPGSAIRFGVEGGEIVIRQIAAPLQLAKWQGYCAGRMAEPGIRDAEEYLSAVRGR